ncbi:hypothetical protein ACLOJK_022747 [Asimina triloba]
MDDQLWNGRWRSSGVAGSEAGGRVIGKGGWAMADGRQSGQPAMETGGRQASVGASAAAASERRQRGGGLGRSTAGGAVVVAGNGQQQKSTAGWALEEIDLEIELNSLMTGEEDSPRVATVINVGLRPRWIWNVLVVAVMMNDSDRGSDGPAVVGLGWSATASSWASFVAVDGGGTPCSTWWRPWRARAVDGSLGRRCSGFTNDGMELRRPPWQPPPNEEGGAP